MLDRSVYFVIKVVGLQISVLIFWLVRDVSHNAGDPVKEQREASTSLASFLVRAILGRPSICGAVDERIRSGPLHFVWRDDLFLQVLVSAPLERVPGLLCLSLPLDVRPLQQHREFLLRALLRVGSRGAFPLGFETFLMI